MINVSKSTTEEIKEFNDSEWVGADAKYYGKDKEWIKEDFVFKATENEAIVGSISGKYEAGVLYIDDVIVAKDKRGLGIGKDLIQFALDFGKEMGGHVAHLITGKNWDVGKFYESMGFVKIADFPNHYHNVDFVVYKKPL